jgi:hypothetical protein
MEAEHRRLCVALPCARAAAAKYLGKCGGGCAPDCYHAKYE